MCMCGVCVCICSGGSRISQTGAPNRKGAPTYYLAKFCQKLHENGENWIRGEGARIKNFTKDVNPPLICVHVCMSVYVCVCVCACACVHVCVRVSVSNQSYFFKVDVGVFMFKKINQYHSLCFLIGTA